MADERHASDTLFLVAEEDWRLYAEDCKLTPQFLAEEAVHAYAGRRDDPSLSPEPWESPAQAYRRRIDASNLIGDAAGISAEDRAKIPAYLEQLSPGIYKRRKKPKDDCDPSVELVDLVRLMTLAHRHHAGGLVWLSWDGAAKGKAGRRACPMHATTLLGISAWTARTMLANFRSWFPMRHMDLALRDLLENPPLGQPPLEACFVYPSIGHYVGHISGCEAELGWRDPQWDEPWCGEGTRMEVPTAPHELCHRELREFTREGVCGKICSFRPKAKGVEILRWTTRRPKGGMASPGELFPHHPPPQRVAGGAGDGTPRAREPFASARAAHAASAASAAPGSSADDHLRRSRAPSQPDRTQRKRRIVRANNVMDSHRIMVGSDAEASGWGYRAFPRPVVCLFPWGSCLVPPTPPWPRLNPPKPP